RSSSSRTARASRARAHRALEETRHQDREAGGAAMSRIDFADMRDRALTFHASMELRSIDGGTRSAEFVASTEKPVPMGGGEREVLRMSGARLERYRRNPVLLDTHDRFDLNA